MIQNLSTLHRLFTPQRQRYPWLIGGVLWAGWLASILLGQGNMDLNGHLIGTDFVAFYTAGKIILSGQADRLYDLELARSIQMEIYGGPTDNFNPYLNPPLFALLVAPFALLPYPWAPALWMCLGILLLWLSLRWLGVEKLKKTFLFSLTWLPVFYAVSFGQNTFFSLAILSLTYLAWIRKKSIVAGLVLSLLFYKPQFLLGVILLWLLAWKVNWRALAGLFIGVGLQTSASLWLLPEATLEYIQYIQRINANLMNLPGFPLWNAYSTQSFWLTLLPGKQTISSVLYWVCTLIGLAGFLQFWRRHRDKAWALYAGALVFMIWAIPYIMVYDWAILIIPAILLWENRPDLRSSLSVIYALIWIVSFFSNSLTYLQLKYLGAGIQISLPVFLCSIILLGQLLKEPIKP